MNSNTVWKKEEVYNIFDKLENNYNEINYLKEKILNMEYNDNIFLLNKIKWFCENGELKVYKQKQMFWFVLITKSGQRFDLFNLFDNILDLYSTNNIIKQKINIFKEVLKYKTDFIYCANISLVTLDKLNKMENGKYFNTTETEKSIINNTKKVNKLLNKIKEFKN